MNEQQSGCKLTGYWGMTEAERASHDALLLNEERWKSLPARECKSYLETLLLHTMVGYNITLSLLDDPQYAEFREHIKSVLASFLCRQEKLLRYIENIRHNKKLVPVKRLPRRADWRRCDRGHYQIIAPAFLRSLPQSR